MRVVVTGPGGFIGRHLCAELVQQGCEVIGVGREGRAGKGPLSAYEAVRGVPDVETLSAILKRHRPNVVVHLAGATQAASFAELLNVNHGYCAAMIDASRQLPLPPLLVTAGSAAEYGAPRAPNRPMQESDEARPLTDYGKSKLAQTALALGAYELSPVSLRLFNVIGPGAPETSAPGRFIARAAALAPAGGVVKTGPLTAVRDFVSVAEIVKVMVGAAHGRLLPGLYNVCSGVGTPVSAITGALTRILPYPVVFKPEREDPGIDVAIGDPSRLNAAGFSITPVDLVAVLTEMALAAGIVLDRECA
jgi:nucleoside-diphosphate-sugar epimerase